MRPLLLLILPVLGACSATTPSSPPLSLSPDGHTVAYFPDESTSPHSFCVLPLTGDSAVPVRIRTPRQIMKWPKPLLVWVSDDQVFVPSEDHTYLIDIHSGAARSSPPVTIGPSTPFPLMYHRQRAIAEASATDVYRTDILSLPALSPITTLGFSVQGLIDGYMLCVKFPADARPVWIGGWSSYQPSHRSFGPIAFESFDLLTPDGELVTPFSHADLMPVGLAHRPDLVGTLSPDHTRLLLASPRGMFVGGTFSTDPIPPAYISPLAIYQIPSATLLYTIPLQTEIVAPAVLTNDALYAITERIPDRPHGSPETHADHQFWLMRFTAQRPEYLLQLPLDAHYPHFSTTAHVTPTDSFLLIHTADPNGRNPRLIKVPLKPGVTSAELRTIVIERR